MQALGRAGLVQSYRGLHGGFVLSRPSAEITVLEVIQAVDPIQRIRSCPLGKSEHNSALCPLHRRLDQAMALVEQSFAQTTLADVLGDDAADQTDALCPVAPEKAIQ